MAMLRSLIHLVKYSFVRQLRSKKTILSMLLLGLIGAAVLVMGAFHPWDGRMFGQLVVLRLVGLFYLPAVALVYGTGALGDDREEGTLVYLLTRPLPRWGVFVGKLLAVVPLAVGLTLGGLWLLYSIAKVQGDPSLDGALGCFLPAMLLGCLAYLAFFHFLGSVFRHSTLIAVAYVFFVEVFIGRVPGILKRVSISFYTWSMVFDSAEPLGVQIPARAIFLPVSGETAARVLLGLTVGLVVLGAILFARREHRDAAG